MGTGLEEPLCKGILVTHPGCMFLRSLLTVPSGQWRCSTLILVTPVILSSVQNQNYSAHSFSVTLHQTSWSVSVHICMLIFNADGVGLLGRFLKLSFCIATPSLEVCATTASSHPTFPEFWSHFLDFMKLLCFPWHLSSALWLWISVLKAYVNFSVNYYKGDCLIYFQLLAVLSPFQGIW